jgi:hypothetical protein
MFCPKCGVQVVPDTTPFCTHCGSPVKASAEAPVQAADGAAVSGPGVQINVINAATPQILAGPHPVTGTYGLPIPAMVIGIIVVLCLLDDSKWDSDQINGGLMFAAAGLTLGIISVCRQRKGKGMAVAGIVLSSIGLLGFIGRLP